MFTLNLHHVIHNVRYITQVELIVELDGRWRELIGHLIVEV